MECFNQCIGDKLYNSCNVRRSIRMFKNDRTGPEAYLNIRYSLKRKQLNADSLTTTFAPLKRSETNSSPKEYPLFYSISYN